MFRWTGLTDNKQYVVLGFNNHHVKIIDDGEVRSIHMIWFGFGCQSSLNRAIERMYHNENYNSDNVFNDCICAPISGIGNRPE